MSSLNYFQNIFIICGIEAVTMAEWISVKDRLPEIYGKYLVACRGNNIPQIRYYDGVWDVWNCVAEVTHWMPLPELPKDIN